MGKDLVTDAQLKAIMPLCSPAKRSAYLPWLNLSMAYFKINTELRVGMYLCQLGHESTDLTVWTENLNYSAKRLMQVWPKRFPSLAAALPFQHNPIALANKTYNGRMGNRAGSNDGWTFRGRSPIQATGHDLYAAATNAVGKAFGVDFVNNPDLLLQVQFGFLVSAWIFAVEKKCLPLADARKIKECTYAINGGYNGLAERTAGYRTALSVLPDTFALMPYDEMKVHFSAVAETTPTTHQDAPVIDVSNQDLYHPEEHETEADEQAPPVPENGVSTSVSVSPTGQVKVESNATGPAVSGQKERVAVVKAKPKPWYSMLGAKITAVVTGNTLFQWVQTQFDTIKDLGLPNQVWWTVGIIIAAGSLMWIASSIWQNYQENEAQKELDALLVKENSTPDNLAQLIPANQLELYRARGFKIITRGE